MLTCDINGGRGRAPSLISPSSSCRLLLLRPATEPPALRSSRILTPVPRPGPPAMPVAGAPPCPVRRPVAAPVFFPFTFSVSRLPLSWLPDAAPGGRRAVDAPPQPSASPGSGWVHASLPPVPPSPCIAAVLRVAVVLLQKRAAVTRSSRALTAPCLASMCLRGPQPAPGPAEASQPQPLPPHHLGLGPWVSAHSPSSV